MVRECRTGVCSLRLAYNPHMDWPTAVAIIALAFTAAVIQSLSGFGFALFIGLYTYLVAAWYLRARELLELVERFGGRLTRLIRRR